MNLTVERLKEHIYYDWETGDCYRIAFNCGNGKMITCNYKIQGVTRPDRYGYYRVSIDGVRYLLHKLIYFYVTGKWSDTIDHVDGNCKNNKFSNLRNTTRLGNMSNLRLKKNNSTGFNGVGFKNGKYYAHAQKNGNRYFRGYFDSIEEAILAREELNVQLGFHENHGKKK